jgi:hypothetical protein
VGGNIGERLGLSKIVLNAVSANLWLFLQLHGLLVSGLYEALSSFGIERVLACKPA